MPTTGASSPTAPGSAAPSGQGTGGARLESGYPHVAPAGTPYSSLWRGKRPWPRPFPRLFRSTSMRPTAAHAEVPTSSSPDVRRLRDRMAGGSSSPPTPAGRRAAGMEPVGRPAPGASSRCPPPTTTSSPWWLRARARAAGRPAGHRPQRRPARRPRATPSCSAPSGMQRRRDRHRRAAAPACGPARSGTTSRAPASELGLAGARRLLARRRHRRLLARRRHRLATPASYGLATNSVDGRRARDRRRRARARRRRARARPVLGAARRRRQLRRGHRAGVPPLPDRARSTPAGCVWPWERAERGAAAVARVGAGARPTRSPRVPDPAAARRSPRSRSCCAAAGSWSSTARSLGDAAGAASCCAPLRALDPEIDTFGHGAAGRRSVRPARDPEHPVPGVERPRDARRAARRGRMDAFVAAAGPGSGSAAAHAPSCASSAARWAARRRAPARCPQLDGAYALFARGRGR